jgi:hypothetical protein
MKNKKIVWLVIILAIILIAIIVIFYSMPKSENKNLSASVVAGGCTEAANLLNSWNTGNVVYTLQPGVPFNLPNIDLTQCSNGIQNLTVYFLSPKDGTKAQKALPKNTPLAVSWKNQTVGCTGSGIGPYFTSNLYSMGQLYNGFPIRTSALSLFDITLSLSSKAKSPLKVSPVAAWSWVGTPVLPQCDATQ